MCVCARVYVSCISMHVNVSTHRHQSEDCVNDSDSYRGVDWLTDTSPSEDSRGVIKDLKEKQVHIFSELQNIHICRIFLHSVYSIYSAQVQI